MEENGVNQTIETFEEAVTPVSIMLALDSSGSMKPAADTARQAASGFVDALRPADQLSVMLFADHTEVAHDLGTDRELSHKAISAYQASGGTALYDAIGDSLDRLKTVDGRRVMIVVTDGRDENNPGTAPGSTRTFNDVLKAAREVDAIIFGIGLGPKVDRAVLETLARRRAARHCSPTMRHSWNRSTAGCSRICAGAGLSVTPPRIRRAMEPGGPSLHDKGQSGSRAQPRRFLRPGKVGVNGCFRSLSRRLDDVRSADRCSY